MPQQNKTTNKKFRYIEVSLSNSKKKKILIRKSSKKSRKQEKRNEKKKKEKKEFPTSFSPIKEAT